MKKQLIQTIQATLLILTVFASSCSKNNESNPVTTAEGSVLIKIGGAAYTDEGIDPKLKQSTANRIPTSTQSSQTVIAQFNDELAVQATLTAQTGSNNLASKGLSASTRAASTPVNLDNGAIYQIAAYDAAGNYKGTSGQLSYSAGASWNINLPAGAYTFVAVAVAQGKTFPAINFNQKLSDITFQTGNADTDLLWQKQNVQVTSGQNTAVSLLLSHLFTQVTVKLESTSAAAVGNITGVSNSTLSPNYAAATVKLTDGSYTGNGQAANRVLSFTGAGLTWTSSPALIITDGTTLGLVNFGTVNLNAGGTAKSGALDLSNLALKKGVKYDLTLRLIPKGALDIPGATVYWGSGNLLGGGGATAATGIESTQVGTGNLYEGKSSTAFCATTMGTGWRTATQADFQQLMNIGKVFGSRKNANGQDVAGWFLGTSVVPTSNLDAYMFLPVNGAAAANNGHPLPTGAIGGYWATTAGGGAATTAVIITNSDITMQPYHQNGQLAIRCVRDK
jgi:hypothetical protein